MKEIRSVEGWYTDEVYTVGKEDDMICFTLISGGTHISHYVELTEFNDTFYTAFESIQLFSDAINKVDNNFFIVLVDRVLDAYLGRGVYQEAYIHIFQLFAKNFNFPAIEVESEQTGYSLGEADGEDCCSVQLNDRLYGERFFVFRKEFYVDEFFTTKLNKPVSKNVLSKLPKLALYHKFKEYFCDNEFSKTDHPEIVDAFNKMERPYKIKKILGE